LIFLMSFICHLVRVGPNPWTPVFLT
jgi:hypothetical protein